MQPRGPLTAPFSITNTALQWKIFTCGLLHSHYAVLQWRGLETHNSPQLHATAFVGGKWTAKWEKLLGIIYSVEKEYNG